MVSRVRTLRSRFAGRVITGPVAFLLAGAIDIGVYALGVLADRARRRSTDRR